MDTRIVALKKLQLELLSKETEFHKRLHLVEVEFQEELAEIHNRRRQIVTGSYNPEKEEQEPEDTPVEQRKGIPGFWLGVFKMTPVLQTMINPADEAVLVHLMDVRSVVFDQPTAGFVLEFEFEENDLFNNRVLTKEYKMQCVPDPEKQSSFNGFEIYDAIGCDVDWKQGAVPTAVDEIGVNSVSSSFLDFFKPKQLFEKFEDSALYKECMETDFEIGFYIKERVIPRAVLFYLGECDDTDSDIEQYLLSVPELTESLE